MIDHRGIVLPLPPFFPRVRTVSGKGLKVGQGGRDPLFVICFAREDYRIITRGRVKGLALVARGIWAFEDAQTLGISNYIPRIRVLRSSWNGHVSPKSSRRIGTSIITPLIRFLARIFG